jgi:hypothetical protein
MRDNKHISGFIKHQENLDISDLEKGIDSLGHTYYYKESEKDGYIDIAQKDKGRIIGWMTVKFGTGIFK